MQSPKLSLPKLKANLNNFAANMNDKRLIQANLQKNGNAELKRLEAELKKIVEGMLRKGTAGLANDYDNGRTVLVERENGLQIAGFDGMIVRQHGILTYPSIPFPMADLQSVLKANEGDIPYLYLDNKGYVTIGIGHVLKSEADALSLHKGALPLYDRSSGTKASDADVKKAYNTVKQAPYPQPAVTYMALTNLSAKTTPIENLRDSDINEKLRQLLANQKFPNFNTYPASIQLIIIDFTYQYGVTGTRNNFDPMLKHIDRRDWIMAKKKSNRSGYGKRNTWTEKLFQEVIEIEDPFFVTKAQEHKLITSDGKMKIILECHNSILLLAYVLIVYF